MSMITSAVIQTSLDSLKSITKVDFCVYDSKMLSIASTFTPEKQMKEYAGKFLLSDADSQIVSGLHLLKIYDEDELLYILLAKGNSDDAYMIAKICASELQALITAYKDRVDRNGFFQNLILDNMLLVDMYNKARKLHIEVNVPRVVFLIESETRHDSSSVEVLKGMFNQQYGDYVTAVDEKSIILIKQIESDDSYEEFTEIASSIVDIMNTEAMMSVRVSFGSKIADIKEVSKSYKEAKLALDVARIFYADQDVVSYNKLGIGRLIYQLPENLCRLFLDEISLDGKTMELDEENQRIIDKFFENTMNVTQTADQLYIHRNTLVYRLEKLEKATGLNIRNFDDALTFKIAMMVSSYIKYLDSQE